MVKLEYRGGTVTVHGVNFCILSCGEENGELFSYIVCVLSIYSKRLSMTSQQTAFQKKMKSKVPNIPGSRLSVQNAQLLVSSGVPSFDNVIGNVLVMACPTNITLCHFIFYNPCSCTLTKLAGPSKRWYMCIRIRASLPRRRIFTFYLSLLAFI